MTETKELTLPQIDEELQALQQRRRDLVKQIWDIDSEMLSLRVEKEKRSFKRYDDPAK